MAFHRLILGVSHYRKAFLIIFVVAACSWHLILEKLQGTQVLSSFEAAEEVEDGGAALDQINEELAKQPFHNTTELIDHVMALTNRYTIHLTDSWHDRNWADKHLVLARLHQAMAGDESAR